MATGGAPESEEETVLVFADWVMLGRIGRTRCHNGLDAARVAVNKNKTAAPLDMNGGPSCYVSFILAAPPKGVSYLNVHWPEEQGSAVSPAYAYVRAADKDLVLFDISTPSQTDSYLVPPDLFVYTAAGSSPPSVQRLPPFTRERGRAFLMGSLPTGILRLKAAMDRYIVAELNVTGNPSMPAELCVFNSGTGKWKIIRKPQLQDQSNGGHFFDLRSIHHVLAFDSRFLCWVDYFSGVLLCDFSTIDSPALRFVPFPGENDYHNEVRVESYYPERYRSVSVSQGKMCFVHIDNDFHDRIYDRSRWIQLPERKRQQQTGQRITIWTLSSEFQWELHRVINLDCLWAQRGYEALGIPQRFPEFPFVSPDDPDVLCCLLREEEFRGKAWTIMVDMNHAYLRSCTPYCIKCADAECGGCVDDRYRFPPYVELLPTVFSKYLESPTTSKERKKKRKRKANRHT
ncbi:uncharacterized protein [Triticum aestivum]|uniref:uncharacterized protein n=1 Tax=Triticum aestivum TaxID=4565 RepID=UPI001D0026EF|nr:uncharacterized protein LOC123117270 [Triticum aestivum]